MNITLNKTENELLAEALKDSWDALTMPKDHTIMARAKQSIAAALNMMHLNELIAIKNEQKMCTE